MSVSSWIQALCRFRLVTATLLADNFLRALLSTVLCSQFGLGTDALQFGVPRPNALLLFEGDTVNPLIARVRDSVRVVRIHLRLRLLLDRRLELRRLVDDREALLIDSLLACFLECLFIDRNDLSASVVIRYWSSPTPKALTRRHRDAATSRFSDDNDRQNHLRALARAFASAPA